MVDFNDTAAFNRYIAAGSVYTTPIVLRHLAQSADKEIRARVAANPNIPREVADLLARDPDADVRIAVSENTAFAFEYLELFVTDESPDVRFAIAENFDTPSEILLRLASDENPYVAMRARKTYAKMNPHAAHELAEIISPPSAVKRHIG
jgi:hypothetical protein